jgi:hypothetical protein
VQVGKIDNDRSIDMEGLREMHSKIPSEFDSMPVFIEYWRETINKHIKSPDEQSDDSWHLHGRDIMALLGAHTLMDNQGCMEETCGGRKRMFSWNNSWFKVGADHLANSNSCTADRAGPTVHISAKTCIPVQ